MEGRQTGPCDMAFQRCRIDKVAHKVMGGGGGEDGQPFALGRDRKMPPQTSELIPF